jgi:hypothetical protein
MNGQRGNTEPAALARGIFLELGLLYVCATSLEIFFI